MKTDIYTKIVLTIIAMCLLIQLSQSVMFAQLRVNAQTSTYTDVNILRLHKNLANKEGNALRVHIVNPHFDPGHVRTVQ